MSLRPLKFPKLSSSFRNIDVKIEYLKIVHLFLNKGGNKFGRELTGHAVGFQLLFAIKIRLSFFIPIPFFLDEWSKTLSLRS